MTSVRISQPVRVKPVTIGPSWATGEDGQYVLPDLSLGYYIAGVWVPNHLQMPTGEPFQLTQEFFRTICVVPR